MMHLWINVQLCLSTILLVFTKKSSQQVVYTFQEPSIRTVPEDVGSVSIVVLRTGSQMGQVSYIVEVNTDDGTASAASADFVSLKNHRMHFANGMPSSKETVSVLIFDDLVTEGLECFNLSLAKPMPIGSRIGASSSVTVCISDNEPPALTTTAHMTTVPMIPSPMSTLPATAEPNTSLPPTGQANKTGLVIGLIVAVIVIVVIVSVIVFFVIKKSRRNHERYTKPEVKMDSL